MAGRRGAGWRGEHGHFQPTMTPEAVGTPGREHGGKRGVTTTRSSWTRALKFGLRKKFYKGDSEVADTE